MQRSLPPPPLQGQDHTDAGHVASICAFSPCYMNRVAANHVDWCIVTRLGEQPEKAWPTSAWFSFAPPGKQPASLAALQVRQKHTDAGNVDSLAWFHPVGSQEEWMSGEGIGSVKQSGEQAVKGAFGGTGPEYQVGQ